MFKLMLIYVSKTVERTVKEKITHMRMRMYTSARAHTQSYTHARASVHTHARASGVRRLFICILIFKTIYFKLV